MRLFSNQRIARYASSIVEKIYTRACFREFVIAAVLK
jgi:hypothetical protein